MKRIKITLPDPIETKNAADLQKIEAKKQYNFKKRLIKEIRKHPRLYNPTHKKFACVIARDQTWKRIAKNLQSDVESSKNVWAELREQYQRYARRLRQYFSTGNKGCKRRPVMVLEKQLLFLWRFVADKRNRCSLPRTKKNVITVNEEEDDLIMIEPLPIIIDVDAEDRRKVQIASAMTTQEMRRLVEIIKIYPELFFPKNSFYTDYKRKGIIWNAIANELNDKATKLMKLWYHMQTRFEWELQNLARTELAENALESHSNINQFDKNVSLLELLGFLKPIIYRDLKSVYKQSFYLKQGWQEPIDNFKGIYNLLATMKKIPDVVIITESLIDNTEKSDSYRVHWQLVAKLRSSTPGQCETTWLIMRAFYWELMNMRKQSYQLQDKWYFETIITELYAHIERKKTKGSGTAEPKVGTTIRRTTAEPVISTSLASSRLVSTVTSTVATTVPISAIPAISKTTPVLLAQLQGTATKSMTCVPIGQVPHVAQPKVHGPTQAKPPIVKLATPYPKLPSGIAIYKESFNTANQIINPSSPAISASSLVPITSSPTGVNLNKVTVPTKTIAPPLTYSISNPQNLTTTVISTATPPVTSVQPIPASLPRFTTAPLPSTSPSVSKSPTMPTMPTLPVPKITSAVSLLNQNEIMIQLVASPNGNHLVVHGPPLTENYSLSMGKMASFIRTVMAIPLLHNKEFIRSGVVTSYWLYISKKFNLPVYVCRACWNFLAENFCHFPQIAPMEKLMTNFTAPNIDVWRISDELFRNFDLDAVQKGWLKYRVRLQYLMEEIAKHPPFYQYFVKNSSTSIIDPSSEARHSWIILRKIFRDLPNLTEMYVAFQNILWMYMSTLELGVDHKWSINWWHVLARMHFLLEERYSKTQPFYYIVRNKIIQEIERCSAFDLRVVSNNVAQAPDIDADALAALWLQKEQPINEAAQVPVILSALVPLSKNIVLPIAMSFLADIHLPEGTPEIDAYNVIQAVKRHPNIYKRCDKWDKVNAWMEVSQELNASESICRASFARAVRLYRICKLRDPSNRCHIAQKYFKDLGEIYRILKKPNKSVGKLNIKTPTELNNQITANEVIYPERFILDINMDNSKTSLVLKNWAFAVGTLSAATQTLMENKLYNIFEKYRFAH